MDKKRKLGESSSLDESQIKKIKMDMDADDASSSPGGQNEMDDQPLEKPDSPIIVTTTAKDNFNPLNTVLPKILSLLPLRHLKTARRVSRRWKEFSTKSFHAFCSVPLICFSETRSYYSPWILDGYIPYRAEEMPDFIQDVRERGTCSFRRFDLGPSIMRKEGSRSVVSDFFSICSPYIEELNIGKVGKQAQLLYEQVLLTTPMTSLRVLRVNVGRKDAFLGDFFNFVGMIVQGSTNLESFALFLDESLSEGQVTNCLIPSLSLCNFDKLVNLDIHAALTSGHFIALSRIEGLRLKSLDLKLRWLVEDPGPFQQFLDSQSGSLEVRCLSGYQSYVIEFPHMMSLKSLAVDNFCYDGPFTFPTLSYPHQFPSLETLSMSHYFAELDHQLIRDDLRPCLTLQELVVKGIFVDGMRITASLFPNLKRLEVPWTTVTQTYSLLPQLEELTFGSKNGNNRRTVIDDLITGIPNEECERIHREGSYEWGTGLGNLAETQTTPSITRLKRLRTLNLNVNKQNDDRGFMRITEASFRLALFHMESLETLDFGYTDLTEISSECMEAIQGQFNFKSKRI